MDHWFCTQFRMCVNLIVILFYPLQDMSQFRATSFRYIFGYIFTIVSCIISLAAFGSDLYTCVVLLAYDRWTSNIQPVVPFSISRWIFAACILFSILIIIINFIIAFRIYKTRNISLTYTNSIARDLYSITRYNYFCLFAKITRSRNKTEYLAFFVYFSYKGWVHLVFAESPRQVINALTLYSVLKFDASFVETIKQIATNSHIEAFTIFLMIYTVVIWAFNVVQFAFALLLTLPIYLHVERSGASGLTEYCCIRIDLRIKQLVNKEILRSRKRLIEENRRLPQQPTIPLIDLDDPRPANGVHRRTISQKRFDDNDDWTGSANKSNSYRSFNPNRADSSPFRTPAQHHTSRQSMHQNRIDQQRRDRQERERNLLEKYQENPHKIPRKGSGINGANRQNHPMSNRVPVNPGATGISPKNSPYIYNNNDSFATTSRTQLIPNSQQSFTNYDRNEHPTSSSPSSVRVTQDDASSIIGVSATVPQNILDLNSGGGFHTNQNNVNMNPQNQMFNQPPFATTFSRANSPAPSHKSISRSNSDRNLDARIPMQNSNKENTAEHVDSMNFKPMIPRGQPINLNSDQQEPFNSSQRDFTTDRFDENGNFNHTHQVRDDLNDEFGRNQTNVNESSPYNYSSNENDNYGHYPANENDNYSHYPTTILPRVPPPTARQKEPHQPLTRENTGSERVTVFTNPSLNNSTGSIRSQAGVYRNDYNVPEVEYPESVHSAVSASYSEATLAMTSPVSNSSFNGHYPQVESHTGLRSMHSMPNINSTYPHARTQPYNRDNDTGKNGYSDDYYRSSKEYESTYDNRRANYDNVNNNNWQHPQGPQPQNNNNHNDNTGYGSQNSDTSHFNAGTSSRSLNHQSSMPNMRYENDSYYSNSNYGYSDHNQGQQGRPPSPPQLPSKIPIDDLTQLQWESRRQETSTPPRPNKIEAPQRPTLPWQ